MERERFLKLSARINVDMNIIFGEYEQIKIKVNDEIKIKIKLKCHTKKSKYIIFQYIDSTKKDHITQKSA